MKHIDPLLLFGLRALLFEEDPEVPEPPVWPDDLYEGDYHCLFGACERPDLNPLLLVDWGGPGLAMPEISGYVKKTSTVPIDDRSLWCWQVKWDDRSGTVRHETLWLEVHDAESFTLYDAEGRKNHYEWHSD